MKDYMHIYKTLTHTLNRGITVPDKRSFPKISKFFGEENKGVITYSTWKYDGELKVIYMFFDFIWNCPSTIKKSIVIKDYIEGALKMTDEVSYMNSLKLTWLRRLLLGGDNKCYALANVIINTEKMFKIVEDCMQK
jgi:hypothetical protein